MSSLLRWWKEKDKVGKINWLRLTLPETIDVQNIPYCLVSFCRHLDIEFTAKSIKQKHCNCFCMKKVLNKKLYTKNVWKKVWLFVCLLWMWSWNFMFYDNTHICQPTHNLFEYFTLRTWIFPRKIVAMSMFLHITCCYTTSKYTKYKDDIGTIFQFQ